jgi:cell wall-associated NlpC family hydrolase
MARGMRRRLVPLLMLVALSPAAALAGVASKASWAQPQIAVVSARGLMGGRAATFRPDAPLTHSALERLVADLTDRKNSAPTAPNEPATMAELDAALVRGLDLGDAAAAFAATARAAGLKPPARFGAEVVARLLGLRTNHPAGQESLELLPADAATRAEAAYSASRVLSLEDREAERVRDAALDFELPVLTPWQARVLRTAVSLVGYPYVWGGTTEGTQAPFGSPAPGGFDCSGFVWRVYKLQQYTGATALAQAIRGRTTMQMSAEVAKRARIAIAGLEPGDVLFFGARGPKSTPAQVDHTAIYLGGGWLIHSSAYGVALAPLSGWYASSFAWARRPLAEAHLA